MRGTINVKETLFCSGENSWSAIYWEYRKSKRDNHLSFFQMHSRYNTHKKQQEIKYVHHIGKFMSWRNWEGSNAKFISSLSRWFCMHCECSCLDHYECAQNHARKKIARSRWRLWQKEVRREMEERRKKVKARILGYLRRFSFFISFFFRVPLSL